MVLRAREWDRGLAVAEHHEGGFLALEIFLDYNARAGLSQAAAEHHVDGVLRLHDGIGDHDSLASGQAVGLDHDRRGVGAGLRPHIGVSCGRVGETRVGGGRNPVGFAQVLGKTLGAFQPCGGLARAEGPDSGGGKIVDDAGAQRPLRSDHDQIDRARPAEFDHRRMIGGIERQQFGLVRDAGVAGRAIESLHQRARRHLPGQRVLAPAGTKEKDVHGCATAPQA